MNNSLFDSYLEHYKQILEPLFFPDFTQVDIIQYVASILRVGGIEDPCWDSLSESKKMLNNFNSILTAKADALEKITDDVDDLKWQTGLNIYSHIVEMSAPYDVITNLLRIKLGFGYYPNPYLASQVQIIKEGKSKKKSKKKSKRKNKGKNIIYPSNKISIIKKLSGMCNIELGPMFDELYNRKLRNAINHSDYIRTADTLRAHDLINPSDSFILPLNDVDILITKSKAYIRAFFDMEFMALTYLARHSNSPRKYDETYKCFIEILADDNLAYGFKLHWPNGVDSICTRTRDGVILNNFQYNYERFELEPFVGMYAVTPGKFSPLVEANAKPCYTNLASGHEIDGWR